MILSAVTLGYIFISSRTPFFSDSTRGLSSAGSLSVSPPPPWLAACNLHAATAPSTWRRCCECTVRTLCQSQGLVGADQRLWPRLPAACWLVQACRSLIRPVVHRCAACAGLVRPRAARPRPPAWTSSSHVVNRDYSTRHLGCATGSTVQTDRQTDPLGDVTSLLSVKVRPRLNKGLNHCHCVNSTYGGYRKSESNKAARHHVS